MAEDNKAYREALQSESLRMFPGTSRKAKLRRKAWRNEQRQAQGFRTESKLSRGGIAGVWDRNKKIIKPIALGAASLLTGGLAAPIALGAAVGGLDREGKGGVGFDVGGGLRGAAEGAAAGGVAQMGAGAVNAARAASSGGASLPGAVWQGVKNLGGQMLPGGGVAPVPVEGAAQVAGQAANATNPSFLARAGNWLKNPQNLLAVGQGLAGTYAEQQALAQQKRALGEFDVPGLDRMALAERNFNRFAASSDPAYQASLRDANRYAASTGRLNSGSLRTEFGNLANLRNQQLDAMRGQFLDDATAQSIADAQWRAENRARGREVIGRTYANRAERGMQALGNLTRQIGRGPVPVGTPPINPNAPKPKKKGMVAPIPMGG